MRDDKDLIAEARQEESIHDKLGDGFSEGSEERAFYYEHRDRYKRLADALETATERASQAEAELRDVLRVDIPSLKAERDAALAAIERVRAIHERDMVLRDYCSECSDFGSDQFPPGQMVEWPCPTIAALDGAPEPEGRWEYRGRLQSCGYVAEGYISAEHAMNGLKVELEDHPYLVMDDTAIVERARVREWHPARGEKP